ncbi:MAG: hypothetical protein DCC75_04200 [Proteobacteria bacterium]|nr:MAG: hypothetical protein DCC75_04200 [Pseudomonadota bacterium]
MVDLCKREYRTDRQVLVIISHCWRALLASQGDTLHPMASQERQGMQFANCSRGMTVHQAPKQGPRNNLKDLRVKDPQRSLQLVSQPNLMFSQPLNPVLVRQSNLQPRHNQLNRRLNKDKPVKVVQIRHLPKALQKELSSTGLMSLDPQFK